MKRIILMFLLAFMASLMFAAAADYLFSYSSGTYSEITGGTVLSTITTDDGAENFALPFGFTYDGIRYFNARVCANGWLKLYNGTAPADTDYSNNIGGTGLLTALCPLFDDLNPTGTPAAEIRYEQFGMTGNRILVIQWKNIKWYGSSGTPQNFQIRLHENGNVIHFVYGTMNTPGGTGTASIGIVDANGGIGNFLSVTPATEPTASSETANNNIGAITYLTSGTTYTFTPPTPTGAPNAATLVSPADGAPAVFVNSTLNWADGGGWTDGFKLLFSPTSTFPPATPTNLGYVTTYDPGVLDPLTPYSWKVIPYNTTGGDNIPATAWTFTTASLPLTGTKVIGSTAPYDYLTFTDAINSLNGAGVGTGGVTFTVQNGTYAENPPAITASGTAANPVLFQPVTGANPVLTPTGGTGTFGFKLDGADYVTFNNIDITAGGTLIYGYWLANGAENCTVQNSTVTMPYGTATNYAMRADTGSNACSFLGNTIASNSYYGIYINGTSTEPIQNAVVEGNVLSGIRNYGLYLYYVQNAMITENSIASQAASAVAFYGMYIYGSSSTVDVSYNTISGGYTGSYSIYGIYNYYANGSFDHNTISNLYNTGSSTWYGFYDYYGGTTSWTNNTITGITNTGTASFYGLYANYCTDSSWSNNEVSAITITSGTLYAANLSYGTTRTFNDNLITGLVGTGTIYGCYVAGGTTANVYNNQIHDLVSNGTSTLVTYGIYISSGTTNNVYNNFVYDLRNPGGTVTTGQVRGIYLAGGTTTNVWNNTVYLNASGTNPNFTTAALYVGTSSTSYSFDLKNNIFVNASTPGSSGWTVAFYKSSAGMDNISTGSDKNIYYAGGEEPGARDVIGYFGTATTYTTYATLDLFKAFAAPRDAGSYSENVPFVSNRLIDLHIDDSVPTRVEGNAIPITEVAFDIDNQERAATPDIGADEGPFTGFAGVPGNVTLLSPADASQDLDPDGLTVSWAAPSGGGTTSYYEVLVSSSYLDQDVDDFMDSIVGQQVVNVPTTSLDISTIDGLELGYQNDWYWAVLAYNNGDEPSDIYDPSFMVWGFSTGQQMQAAEDLALGSVWPGVTYENTLLVTNIGDTALTFTVDGSDEFRFDAPPFNIPANSSLELPYEFVTPLTSGAYSGWITLTETSPGSSIVEIDVTGTISTEIAVGDGTTTTLNLPIYPYYGYSYSQVIYPNEWLQYPEGYRIDKIYYQYASTIAPTNTQDFKIWMGHTTQESFPSTGASWLPVDQMTLVFDGIWTITDGVGWKEIVLQTPFLYNGTQNLVIAVDENTPGYNTGKYFYQTDTPSTYYGIYYGSDSINPDPTNPTITPGSKAGYPNTKFFLGELPAEAVLTVNPDSWTTSAVLPIATPPSQEFAITNGGLATLTVTSLGFSTGTNAFFTCNFPSVPFDVDLGDPAVTFTVTYTPTSGSLEGTQHTGSIMINGQEYPLTGTCYDPRIVSLPRQEYFDLVTAPAMPLGWTGYVNSTTTNAVVATYSSTTYAQSAPNSARMYNSTDASADLRLITPQILVDMEAIRLKFYARGSSTGDFVLIGTTDSPGGSGTFHQLASLSLTTTKTEYTYEFDDYEIVPGDQYICFKLGTGETYNYAYIDNFILEEVFTVPTLYVSPSEWDFDDVELSNPATKVFQFYNLGTGTITINEGDIYTNNPEFTVAATYPIALTYGNPPVDVTVTFTPTHLGSRTATLSIDDNVGTRTVHTYALSGNGVAEPTVYTALYAEVENINDVVLNWGTLTPPSATPGYLHYDNGTNSSGVGSTTNPANFDVAIKLETAVLEDWAGMDITQIRFYAYSASATYTLKVWTGSDGSLAPTTEVRSIPVTPTIGAWNEVNLANPYLITGNEAIWIGYNCDVTITGSIYPAGADAGPAVRGFGDLLNLGGEWYSLSANSTINRNWNIQAYVDVHVLTLAGKPENPGIPVKNIPAGKLADKSALTGEEANGQTVDARGIMGFNVYRDGSATPLNSALLNAYTYTDENLSAGLYEYTVQAVQYSQTGPMSNIAEALVPGNDLAATAIASPEFYGNVGSPIPFNVTVFNNGLNTQSAYRVKLMNADGLTQLAYQDFSTPIASGASQVLTVNWTPLASGTYQVYGEVYFEADQNADNNACYSTEMYVISATMDVIGVGNEASTVSSYSYPLNYYYKNSLTEELYFTDEMHLTSGSITAIVYRNTFTSNLSNKPVKIWMATTPDTDLTGNWKTVTYTQVFDGLVDFPSGSNYIVIPLSPAFNYTGGNLLTRVNRPMDTVTYTTTDKFYYTATANHPNRTRYAYSDTETFNPLTPPATSYTVSNVPNTWFVVSNPVMHPEAVLSGHVYIQGTSTPIVGATVTTQDRNSTTTDENGYYEFRFWEAHTVDASAAQTGYYDLTYTNISLPLGTPVTQDFYLVPLPQVSVSGTVTSNDYPAGLVGATVSLFGYDDYEVQTGTGGAFSITGVYGNVAGEVYSVVVEKDGYTSYIGTITVYGSAVTGLSYNLVEYLWTPYNLVASHEGADARLNWDPAGIPDFDFYDFEADNGGFTVQNNNAPGWEYGTSTYAGAHSGTKIWATGLDTQYANSAVYQLMSPATGPLPAGAYLNFWHRYWFEFYTTPSYYDGGIVQISTNGGANWTTLTPVGGYPCTSTTGLGSILMYGGQQDTWTLASFDLSEYAGDTVMFNWKMLSETSVTKEGWFIDDVFIGIPIAKTALQRIGSSNGDRVFLNYDVYRLLAADEGTPANWTLLDGAVANPTYLDNQFSAQPEGSYKWAVKANYSGTLESEAIFSNALGLFVSPPVFDMVQTTVVGSNVNLAWAAEPGATYYKVYGSNDPYAAWPSGWTFLGNTATPSFTFNANTTPFYFFKVAAADGVMPAPAGRMDK
jgi:hypothetical protein